MNEVGDGLGMRLRARSKFIVANIPLHNSWFPSPAEKCNRTSLHCHTKDGARDLSQMVDSF